MKFYFPTSISNNGWNLMFIFSYILFFSLAFYPGVMSDDSLFQYNASRSFVFNDWHPPAMSIMWRLMDVIFPYGGGLFALQMLMLAAIFHILSKSSNGSLYLIILIFPFIFNFIFVIWKDVQMTLSFVLAVLIYFKTNLKFKNSIVFLLIFYAVSVRHNAIILAFVFYFLSFSDKLIFKRVIYSMLLCSVLFFSKSIVLNKLFDIQKTNVLNYVFVDDLTYFSLKNGVSLIPGLTFDQVSYCSKKIVGGTTLIARDFCFTPDLKVHDVIYKKNLFSIWFDVISVNKFEYLKFRTKVFGEFLRLGELNPFYVWQSKSSDNTIGFDSKCNSYCLFIETIFVNFFEAFSFLFKPYLWLLLGIIFVVYLFVAKKIEKFKMEFCLVLSSLAYLFSFFPFVNMYDFRYSYILVFSLSISLIGLVLFGRRN